MQILNRSKFSEWAKTDEGLDMLADFIESLPRPLSIRGSNLSTPQMRLQFHLEAEGIATNVPLPEDKLDRAPTGDELEPE